MLYKKKYKGIILTILYVLYDYFNHFNINLLEI